MDKNIQFILLYDYYGNLLTDKQQQYFEDYYFNNLTLSEISENNKVSRNAVHKQLKEANEKLLYYEENLNLLSKAKKIRKILKDSQNKELMDKIENLI